MDGKYMAKISTVQGIKWFYIGDCKNYQDAMTKAKAFTKDKLHGSASQVRIVMPKHRWLDELRSCEGRKPKGDSNG